MAAPYQDAMLRRLDLINQMGDDALTYEQQAAARQQAAQPQFNQATQEMMSRDPVFTPSSGGGNTFANFLHAIAQRESGGNYHARNADSGALGKYQIMPGNVAGWSREALGHSITPEQFYDTPGYQDRIASYELGKYYSQFGPAGAAVAWYAGPGTARRYVAENGRGFNAPQGKYSSISAYALGILRAMGLR